MPRFFRALANLPAIAAGTALFALMVLTFADVMLRSIFNAPIQAGADLTRLLMAVVVFSVLPVLSFRGGHISVDLLDGFFERLNLARWCDAVISITCGAMLVLPAERIWVLAERSRSYGDVMEYLGMQVHYLVWFIAILTGLTAIAFVTRGLILIFRPQLLERSE